MIYLLHFHANSCHTNAPQCYVYTYVACLVNFCTQGRKIIVFLTRISTFAGMKAVMAKWINGWNGGGGVGERCFISDICNCYVL